MVDNTGLMKGISGRNKSGNIDDRIREVEDRIKLHIEKRNPQFADGKISEMNILGNLPSFPGSVFDSNKYTVKDDNNDLQTQSNDFKGKNINSIVDISGEDEGDDTDSFGSFDDLNISGDKKRVPAGIKIFTFLFIAAIIAGVIFLLKTGKTESAGAEGNQKSGLEKFYSRLSSKNVIGKDDGVKNESNYDNIIDSQGLPPGVAQSGNVFVDSINDVTYLPGTDGKITVQESVWDSKKGANKRIQYLRKSGLFEGKNIKIDVVREANENIYCINISDYFSVHEANQNITEFKSN